MKINVLAKVIGEKSAVGIIGLLFGDEGKLELARGLDSERLLSAVQSEANMGMRLKKASVLIAALRATRAKIMATAKKAATEKSEDTAALSEYAAQISDLDKNIASLQLTLDAMTEGKKNASKIVDKIQRDVTANIVNDELTLTKKALNQIMNEQVAFTQDMIDALPGSNIGSKLRKSVEEDVENDAAQAESMLEALQRLAKNQGDAIGEPQVLDEAGEAALKEILGK